MTGPRAAARSEVARPARDPRRGYVALGALSLASALAAGGCGGKSGSSDAAADLPVDTDVPELGGGGHGSCPTTLSGPALVRVSWSGGVPFCVDSTEVTNAQYQVFLAAASPPAPNARCAWNASLAPAATGSGCSAFDPTGHPDHPVACVDWCDADSYCRWAGKYLCSAASLGGEPVDPVTNPSAAGGSQWILACTNDGMSTYPYSGSAVAGRCVDKKYPSTDPGIQPVKSATLCEGGVAGLFDMAGNVSEWQNDCVDAKSSADGKEDECDAYGGARSSETADTSCVAAASPADTSARFSRAQFAADNGFRCCANALF
jgi:sulfatase modifying factor 1